MKLTKVNIQILADGEGRTVIPNRTPADILSAQVVHDKQHVYDNEEYHTTLVMCAEDAENVQLCVTGAEPGTVVLAAYEDHAA